jgi:L-lactate dehydrogenase complex protein LldF
MKAASLAFSSPAWLKRAQTIGRFLQRPFARHGTIPRLPGPLGAWTRTRDLPAVPAESFRQWWDRRQRGDA